MKEHLPTLVAALKSSWTLDAAKSQMKDKLGFTPTSDALYNVFRREGLGSPTSFLRTSLDTMPPDDDDPNTGEWLPFEPVVESFARKILFIPDTHVPHHDREAFALAVEVGKTLRPDVIVILGDFLDCESVSQHDPLPGERVGKLIDEIREGAECLDALDSIGAREKVWVMGNHEWRVKKMILKHAAALEGMPGLSIEEALHLRERGWKCIPYHEHFDIGDLSVTHDVGRAGVTAVRQSRMAFGKSLVIGHVHRATVEYENTVDGEPRVGASFGWLGDVERVSYRHRALARREWVHGVGIGYIDDAGHVHVQPCPFIGGRAVVEGRVVTVRDRAMQEAA